MTDYRRGLEVQAGATTWQRLWHYNPKCPSFPTRNFECRPHRPADDDLCSRCHSRDGER